MWAALDGQADVLIEDDASDVHQLQALLPSVAAHCDLLLGPYSTVLMRAAGDMAAESGWLIWNHGGSGDDVETAHPGHVVSVLTPTSRYMEPFLYQLATEAEPTQELRIDGKAGSAGKSLAGQRLTPGNWASRTSAWVRLMRSWLTTCPRTGC